MRIVARDGEAVQPSATALVGDFLLAASTTSGMFHAVADIDLTLSDASLQSKWKQFAAHHLEQLQKQGKTWITDIWPDATIVPQSFIDVANRTESYLRPIEKLLASGDTRGAAALINDLAGDIAEQREEIAAYKQKLVATFEVASKYITELLIGKGNVTDAIIADTAKIADLVGEIDKLRKRIEDRINEAIEKMKWETAKFTAIMAVFMILKDETRILKDMLKQIVVVAHIGTATILKPEDFTAEQVAIMRKTFDIGQVGRDVILLANLGGLVGAIAATKPRLDLTPVEKILVTAESQLKAAAESLAKTGDAAAARKVIGEFADSMSKLSDDCTRFQQAAVEAQKPPTVTWYAPQ